MQAVASIYYKPKRHFDWPKKCFFTSKIDYSSSVIWISQKTSLTVKFGTEFTIPITKSNSLELSNMTFFACCVSVAIMKVLLRGFLCYWAITVKRFCQLYSLYCYQNFPCPLIYLELVHLRAMKVNFSCIHKTRFWYLWKVLNQNHHFHWKVPQGFNLWWQLNPCYTLVCFWCIILLFLRWQVLWDVLMYWHACCFYFHSLLL